MSDGERGKLKRVTYERLCGCPVVPQTNTFPRRCRPSRYKTSWFRLHDCRLGYEPDFSVVHRSRMVGGLRASEKTLIQLCSGVMASEQQALLAVPMADPPAFHPIDPPDVRSAVFHAVH